MEKTVYVSLKQLPWPKHRESINGFRDKQEVREQMKDLTVGLKALRLWTENIASISFYPKDIAFFKP